MLGGASPISHSLCNRHRNNNCLATGNWRLGAGRGPSDVRCFPTGGGRAKAHAPAVLSLAGAGAGAAEGLQPVDATQAPKHQQPCHCIHHEPILNPGHRAPPWLS